ncbi:MAG: phosphate ABC transporter permease PstA [Planctomycetia bacterium]|nr:phosphate ABC transporter permease PstA [Planctomycetia bacterium]
MKKRSLFYRQLKERGMVFVSLFALSIALGGMFWILGTTCLNGFSVLSWDFLTEPSKPYGIEPAGIGNALAGTFCITFAAALIALPPALAGGIWLAEYGKNKRFANMVRFGANTMMGIPSIITGLFIYAVFVVPAGHFSGFAGSLALAIIMLPIIMRTTEDMLLLVPNSIREAALALGMNRFRTTVKIVCRSARNGLITGIMIALARVGGETAPLLFTALYANTWCEHFFSGPTPNVPVLITEYATNSPYDLQHAQGWGAALIMMIFLLMINIGVRHFFAAKEYSK